MTDCDTDRQNLLLAQDTLRQFFQKMVRFEDATPHYTGTGLATNGLLFRDKPLFVMKFSLYAFDDKVVAPLVISGTSFWLKMPELTQLLKLLLEGAV